MTLHVHSAKLRNNMRVPCFYFLCCRFYD